ncbi:MAG: choice-of-anchor I family protein [Bacteroidota bacterium]
MRKFIRNYWLLALLLLSAKVNGQALLISEMYVNPAGTDSCKEFVELIATKDIDFSKTPYSVIVCNNGTATIRGWKEGKAITYAFEINSGSIKAGEIGYVGGSCMKITGTKLRTINTMTTSGDGGIGQSNASGVFGNGGTSADGAAVFDLPLSSVDSISVPIDALFYGSAFGGAIVSSGAAGYQLPNNDLYSGGKLTAAAYLTADPSGNYLVAKGEFDPSTGTFKSKRTHTTSSTSPTDGKSDITFAGAKDTTKPTLSFNILNNDSNIAINSSVIITFSESIRLANGSAITSSNADTLILFKEGNNTGPSVGFSVSFVNKQLTITPTSVLKSSQTYYILLKTNYITDSTGNSATGNNTILFKTQPIQTQFKAGDLAYVAFRMNATGADDEFAFVTFVDILPGTQIRFTDAKFTTNAPAQCAGGLIWTAPASGVASGTIITIKNDLPSTNLGGVSGSKFGLSSGGDQIIAYTGPNTSPTHITALSSNAWLSANTVCSGSLSMLPTSLTNATNAIEFSGAKGSVTGNTANSYYNGKTSGSIAELKALIHDTANWIGSASGTAPQTWPTWGFPGSPTVTKVELVNATTLRVIFSRDMDSTSAVDANNYKGISGLNTIKRTNNASALDTITLVYSSAFSTGTTYTITVQNVKDAESRMLFKPFDFTFTYETKVSFASRFIAINEDAKEAIIKINIQFPGVGTLQVSPMIGAWSTATNADFTYVGQSINIDASANASIDVKIPIIDDNIAESDEYFALSLESKTPGISIIGAAFFTVYIKDNDRKAPVPQKEISLNFVESFNPNPIKGSTTEIVVHDAKSQRLFMTSAIQDRLDIADFANPKDITLIKTVDMSTYGGITSVAVNNGLVAVASPNANEQLRGQVVFFDTDGNFINKVEVGFLPDMITFSPDGNKVFTANEGQPNLDYSIDPEGSVSIIDLTAGASKITNSDVKEVSFSSFNNQETALLAQGVRKLYAPSTLAQDFEPEFVTISADNKTAWVTLQENNAIAEIDVEKASVSKIWAMGSKNWSKSTLGFDASDNSGHVLMNKWPVNSFYIPDAINNYTVNGKTYLLTANEGDEKEYTPLNERTTVSAVKLDSATFPNRAQLMESHALGRFRITTLSKDIDNDGDIDEINSVGARSFTIWNPEDGSLVYDNDADFELITAQHPAIGRIFNADNENNTFKTRSRAKGPEPEGATVAEYNGEYFAFIALERTGGVMVYKVTDPKNPIYQDYQNSRSNTLYSGDNGPEGIQFIRPENSPTGKPYVIVANELSGTVAVFEVQNNMPINNTEELTAPGKSLSAYPNPSNGLVNLNKTGIVLVTNALGQVVFQSEKPVKSIDLSTCLPGIYAITVGNETTKVVVK